MPCSLLKNTLDSTGKNTCVMKESFLAGGCKKTFLRSEDCLRQICKTRGLRLSPKLFAHSRTYHPALATVCGLVVSHSSFKNLSQPGCPTSAFDHHSMLPVQEPAFGHYLQPQSYGRMPARKYTDTVIFDGHVRSPNEQEHLPGCRNITNRVNERHRRCCAPED